MKKILISLITVLCLLTPTLVSADNPNVIHVSNNPRVIDEDDLLTNSEELALTKRLNELTINYGLDVVIVIPKSLNGEMPMVYADDFYDYNNYSKDGILLLLCLEDRDWYVSTSGKGINYVTDYGIDWALDKCVNDLSKGNYYDGFNTFIDCINKLCENASNGNPINYSNPIKEMKTGHITASLIIAAVVTLIVVIILINQLRSVKVQRYAGNYIVPNSYRQIGYSNYYTGTTTSRRKIERNDSSSSHSSSSGSSHGGHGGKF